MDKNDLDKVNRLHEITVPIRHDKPIFFRFGKPGGENSWGRLHAATKPAKSVDLHRKLQSVLT